MANPILHPHLTQEGGQGRRPARHPFALGQPPGHLLIPVRIPAADCRDEVREQHHAVNGHDHGE